jgi:hypothetical protein
LAALFQSVTASPRAAVGSAQAAITAVASATRRV